MKDHFFVSSCDGALHDTRDSDWSKKPLRPVFNRHYREIENTQQLRATLRAGKTTDLGGYPLFFITSDGAALSFEAVRAELRNVLDSIAHRLNDGWRVVACDINYEDADLTCEHTGKAIPSAYGESDDED